LRTALMCASILLLSACGASQAEVDALNKRVAALERQVRAENGPMRGKVKMKAKAKAKMKAANPARPTGSVEVSGDVGRVFVAGDGGRLPVPGAVPAGSYLVLATFAEGAAPVKAGSVDVVAGQVSRLVCQAANQTCVTDAP
jgi:hypothetical protein